MREHGPSESCQMVNSITKSLHFCCNPQKQPLQVNNRPQRLWTKQSYVWALRLLSWQTYASPLEPTYIYSSFRGCACSLVMKCLCEECLHVGCGPTTIVNLKFISWILQYKLNPQAAGGHSSRVINDPSFSSPVSALW